jgi:hypothetical protein
MKTLTNKKRAPRKSVAHTITGVRAILRSVGRRDDMELGELRQLDELHQVLDQAITDAVSGLRSQGSSWAHIAQQLGTTRQAAQQRYGSSGQQIAKSQQL